MNVTHTCITNYSDGSVFLLLLHGQEKFKNFYGNVNEINKCDCSKGCLVIKKIQSSVVSRDLSFKVPDTKIIVLSEETLETIKLLHSFLLTCFVAEIFQFL